MKIRRLSKWVFTACAGLALAGLTAPLAHSATLFGQLGFLDTSGTNPATGQPWQLGDQYRLVFISSIRATAEDRSDNIADWNALAQGFANNATHSANLGSVSWFVIGSTATVDARDNTSTNPNVSGAGHTIMLINGSTVIANDFNDLWGGPGSSIQNIINLTENEGQTIGAAPGSEWPWTGTNASGVALSEPLRSGTGNIRQGQGNSTVGWIDRDNISGSPAARSSSPQSIYVMSEPLMVIPEPSTALLIGLGGLALLRRRRK